MQAPQARATVQASRPPGGDVTGGSALIGTVLDKYEILQKIGEGGMASVYRGRHVTLGRDVAIKVLHPHLSRVPRNRQRFAREARAIENLDHDNILRIFDYSGESTEHCYIVTEFVDGQTLQQLLVDHGVMPSEVVAQLGMRLAEALQYAHDQGIIHRDLKPENVMLRRDGTVKLMDFGIARFLDEMHLTVTGALVGSPAYMSPEQAMERVLDSRSDLFSLGTLLFHLVTGQLPFSGNNPSIVLRNIIEGNRPGVADLAPAVAGPLADLIHSLLQTDPDDRPRTAAEVGLRLGNVLTDIELDPEDPSWSLQAWLVDPAGYRERLDDYLRGTLLFKGKERLEARDHLGALQLFNRLLSIDEDNPEVLGLVQGMHGAREQPHRTWGWWTGGVGLVIAASLLTWLLWPAPPTAQDGPEKTAVPATMVSPALPPAELDPTSPSLDDPPELGSALVGDTSLVQTPAPSPPALHPGPMQRRADPEPRRLMGPPAIPAEAARLAAAATATAGSAALAPGYITVHIPKSWGYIYVDGVNKGRTGAQDPIEVSPGTHTLTVKNPLALPHEQQFTVASGDTLHISTPELQHMPTTVTVGASVDGACTVWLDRVDLGSVAALGHRIELSDPEQRYQIDLDCPTGTTHHQVGPLQVGETATIP